MKNYLLNWTFGLRPFAAASVALVCIAIGIRLLMVIELNFVLHGHNHPLVWGAVYIALLIVTLPWLTFMISRLFHYSPHTRTTDLI